MKEVLTGLRSERALNLLYNATTALSSKLTKAEVARVIAEQLVEALNAEMCAVFEVSGDGLDYLLLDSIGVPPDLIQSFHRFPVETPLPTRDVLFTKQPVFIESPEAWRERYGPLHAELGARAALPLIINDDVIGAVTILFSGRRSFPESDRQFILTLALQCAQALERARLYDAEHDARMRAEEANAAKSQFLNVMSHELRTPLNAVIGYAELLLMQVRGPLTPDQQRQVEGIRTSASHQLGLIEEILDFASIDAGKVEVHPTPVNLAAVVLSAADLVRAQAESKGLALHIDIPSEVSFATITDAAKLRQILLNLLSNAIKFTLEGEVSMALRVTEESFVLSVRDTGPGIPEESRAAIWQPFTQLHMSPNSPYPKGTGLGLPIALTLARLVGGELTVAGTSLGAGTVFELSLPRHSA